MKTYSTRSAISVIWVLTAFLALLCSASAQADFTLQAAPFSPGAVDPGGTSSSSITIGAINGFTGTVSLTCQVSTTQTSTADPTCAVSPTTVTPPAGATATITTTGLTTPAGYSITITGTGPSTTHTTQPQVLAVLAASPQFTIAVQSPVVPSSVPAGNGGQGVIVLNPINGYISPTKVIGGKIETGITLSCASITPLVTIAPVCSFNPPNPALNGTPVTSTITISTYGPVVTGARMLPRNFYAIWLSVPLLGLVGAGAIVGGKRSRKAGILLGLFVLSGVLLLIPACGNNTTATTSSPNGTTPNNTYTFTVAGVDLDGVVSSNTTSSTSANPTVSLTVTSATK